MDNNYNPQDIQNEANQPVQSPYQAAAYTPEPNYVQVYHKTSSSNRDTQPLSTGSPKPVKKRGGLVGLMLVAMLVLGMLLGGAGAEAVMLFAGQSSPATATTAATTSTATTSSTSAELVAQSNEATINSIYQKTSPSVVMINSTVQSSGGRFGGTTTGEATGTGMVLDKQGDILTNYHVIQGASSVQVQLADGSTYAATVVGTAQQDDLAVIKASIPSDKLTPIALGDSSTVKVGDEVIAIGYPYGLDQSVTSGIVSGLNRDGSGSGAQGNPGRTLTGLIQVDAAINPGNSGGPLLNADGQVIGVNTMIESPVDGFTGVGLSIPINNVKSLLSQLEQGSTVQRPWLGISGAEIDSSLQQQYNLPVGQGILVIDVTSGSPAAAAGLQGSTISGSQNSSGQMGDIITAIDGHRIASMSDLTNYLNTKQPGDKVSLSILRNGQQQTVTVTLGSWPASTGSTGATGTNS